LSEIAKFGGERGRGR